MPGDNDRILEALDAVQAELRKRHMTLIHKRDCIVLAIRDTRGPNTFKALAQVAFITPTEIRWRPIDNVESPGQESGWLGMRQ